MKAKEVIQKLKELDPEVKVEEIILNDDLEMLCIIYTGPNPEDKRKKARCFCAINRPRKEPK